MRGSAGSYWGKGQGRSCSKAKAGAPVSWGTRWGPPWEPGGEGHPGQAYLTLELGCELGWPGCGDGWGGGGIDWGVCTCWPGDGEDSMVRLFWLTWKWRGQPARLPHALTPAVPLLPPPTPVAQTPSAHRSPLTLSASPEHTFFQTPCPMNTNTDTDPHTSPRSLSCWQKGQAG